MSNKQPINLEDNCRKSSSALIAILKDDDAEYCQVSETLFHIFNTVASKAVNLSYCSKTANNDNKQISFKLFDDDHSTIDLLEVRKFDDEYEYVKYVKSSCPKQIFLIFTHRINNKSLSYIKENCCQFRAQPSGIMYKNMFRFSNICTESKELKMDDTALIIQCDNRITLLAEVVMHISAYFIELAEEYDFQMHTLQYYVESKAYCDFAKIILGVLKSKADVESKWEMHRGSINHLIETASELSRHIERNLNDIEQEEKHSFSVNKFEQQYLNQSVTTSVVSGIGTEEGPLLSNTVTRNISAGTHKNVNTIICNKIFKFLDLGQEKQSMGIVLCLPYNTNQETDIFVKFISKIFDKSEKVVNNLQDCITLTKETEFFIFIILSYTDNDEILLNELHSLQPTPSIYILGTPPDTFEKRDTFFTKYSQVRSIVEKPTQLAPQVVLDIAYNCRIKADEYSRNGNKIVSNVMYDQCTNILQRLKEMFVPN